jgi:hypothetical protein
MAFYLRVYSRPLMPVPWWAEPLTVRLELFGELTIAVYDQSSVRPCPLPRRPGQHQHGLALLASLAKAWGCQQEPDGKVVWCALDVL